jgi:aspartate aminotransferase
MENNNKRISLNLNVRGLGPSATLEINERSNQLISKGTKVYKLGLGQSPFPVPAPVVDALRLNAHEKNYLPVKGLKRLREAVAECHRKTDKVDARAENVLIGPGSKELMFLLQIVYYGEIVVPTPCWVSYAPQARITERKIVFIPTTYEDKWRISADQLAEMCERECDMYRPRLLVLNYPGNPDGLTHSETELKAIAKVAREYEVLILSDEIYGRLHHKGEHVSIARYYPEGTIISSGLSKWCGAGGWRLGTFAFPPDMTQLMNSMASVASETYTSVSAPIQYAAVRAFRGGVEIERYLCHVRRILVKLGNQCHRMLTQAGVRIHPPTGAFYLFLDFTPLAEELAKRGIVDGPTLCNRLLEDKQVAMIPGLFFGRPKEELTARMAYVDFDGPKALAASEGIPLDQPLSDDFTGKWCEDVVVGTQRIVDWIEGK